MRPLRYLYNCRFAISPALLSISFILSIYLHNMSELFLSVLFLPLGVVVIFSVILSWVFIIPMKDKDKRSLFLSLFILLIYSYGEVIYLLNHFDLKILAKDHFIFPLWLLLIVSVFFRIKKTEKNLTAMNKFVLLFSVLSVFIPLFGIAKFEITERLMQPPVKSSLDLSKIDKPVSKENLPDIYYIVPDSYASPEVLKKFFNYHDESFIKYLEQKGFYVPQNNTSNYPKTFLSLSSTLNMEYLDYLSDKKDSADMSVVIPLINDSNVRKILNKADYKYYQMGSWWQFTNNNPLADVNYTLEGKTLGSVGLFNYSILQSTILSPFIDKLIPKKYVGDSDAEGRDRDIYQFNQLPEISKLSGPKFVFAHILTPHIPYVFGKNCEWVTKADTDKKTEEENYVNQINCVNLQLKNTIEKLIETSKNPPVIIIQSDEGVPFLRDRLPSTDSWKDASDDIVRKKFPIFAAYYLPGISTSTLSVSTSNVNIFRQVFDAYFKIDLPVLPDKNYIFKDMNNLYDFIDVTDKLKKIE